VSILYKTQLPLLLVFNKVDVMAHDFAVAWMRDYEAFRAAIAADSTYAAELSRSLCLVRAPASASALTYPDAGTWVLEDRVPPMTYPAAGAQVLEEFYEGLATVGVSAATGEGMDDFFAAVSACAREYEQHYLPELQRRRRVRRRRLASSFAICRLCSCAAAPRSATLAQRHRTSTSFELGAGARLALLRIQGGLF